MTEAAEMVGLKRPTFYRKIDELGISTIKENGRQRVDVSELIRVFGSDVKLKSSEKPVDVKGRGGLSKVSKSISNDTQSGLASSENIDSRILIVQLEGELDKERELKKQIEEQIDFLKQQLEDEKSERKKAHALLTDQRQKTEQVLSQGQTKNSDTDKKIRILRQQNQKIMKELLAQKNKSIWKKLFG